jgi:hypothetical protein
MSYNTTTISNVFTRLYSTLRRVYAQYAANYSSRQYLVFANVLLKRPDRIPYYSTVSGAQNKTNPAGNLPLDISPYYFKERPIYFYNQQQFMDWRIAGKTGYTLAGNPPYIILNLFLNGRYQDVYVNYDGGKMDIELFALDALLFVQQEKQIVALQKLLEDTLLQLVIAYNQLKALEQAQAQGKYSNASFITKWKSKVDGWISSLQNDPRFVVKVCKECGTNAALGTVYPVAPITYITMTGAVSLTWLLKSYAQYGQVHYYLDELYIEVERLRIDLDTQWRYVQGYTGPVDAGANPMAPGTVTATIPKPTAKKDYSWLWWLLGGAAVVGVARTGNKKSK